MKSKKPFLRKCIALLILSSLIFLSLKSENVKAENDTSGLFVYNILKDGTISVTGYINTGDSEVTIPPTIDGYKVTVIGESAFEGVADLTGIVLPDGMIEISDNAFKNCINLVNLELPSSISLINMDAFYGCQSLKDIYCPGIKDDYDYDLESGNETFSSATFHYGENISYANITENDYEDVYVITKMSLQKKVKHKRGKNTDKETWTYTYLDNGLIEKFEGEVKGYTRGNTKTFGRQ